jgi:hypothetical protein
VIAASGVVAQYIYNLSFQVGQWAFSRRSCAAFLCLYFSLQALLFVKRTLSSSSLVGTAGMVPKGNAVAELARKVEIMINRTIYEAVRIVIWFVVC